MNKKASNSAINNKLFLGFWFVLFAALVLMVNWLFHIPVTKADELITRLADTDKQITRLKAIHAEFLLSQDKEDNLFTTEGNPIENEANSIIVTIKNNIEYLKTSNQLTKKPAVLVSLNEFATILTEFRNDLQDLFMVSREQGDKNSGLVSRWLGLSKGMLAVSNKPNEDVLRKLNQIKQFESEYLLYRDIRTLENISNTVEEIRSQLTSDEGGIILQDIDSYMVLTGNLMVIEKRMGHTGTQGIVPDLEKSIKKLPVAFDTVDKLIKKSLAKTEIWWTIARYLVIILVVAIYIYLFISVFSIVDPLKQLASFCRKLTIGEFPDETIAVGNLPDMHIIKESLEKHVSSLREKLAFANTINQDMINTRLTLSGEHDLLGIELIKLQQKILVTAEKQTKNDEENMTRRYINEGLAKFGNILRSTNDDFNALGDAFIREIVKYLNAIQGGFFVYDDTIRESPVLNLVAAFAYNRKKYLQKSISFGEGLVGTCAREKQSINLTEIPAGYISITSGLGDTLPDNLLLIPVIHENELIGVLEIASLHKFRDHEIEFAEEVSRSLGSTIVYTRNNQRTVELLTKSQQQALEMTEQEEEMRQNMEELKATQEESNRREEEFRGIAEAIGNVLFIVEYDLDGKIREINERFCIFLVRDHDEIIGKQHQDVFQGNIKPDSEFWEEIQKNGHFNVLETIKVGKSSFKIKEHFTTVLNREGIAVKFINFATDDRTGNC
jgi:PAS domain-containing protein